MVTELTGVSKKVFDDRYALKDKDGKQTETYPEEMWHRVAHGISEAETDDQKRGHWEERFYEILSGFKFIPGGRILAGAGTGHAVTFYNCFVLPSPEDSRAGIMDNLKAMTEVFARGGGCGINLSSLRPRGSYIRTVNGTSSGPVSWAHLYSVACGDVIQQGGSRRGALLLMLNDDHPDIEEFITVKKDHTRLNHANLSVGVSDAFMTAVRDDTDWNLKWNGEVKKTVKARYLWDLICQSAWESAEPGLVFMERYNKLSNTWYYQKIVATNPCAEQGLEEYGSCNLGSLNLSAFVVAGELDLAGLRKSTAIATRFLDDAIDTNLYFDEKFRIAQMDTRRAGLGTVGLADALIKCKIRYGSPESLLWIDRVYSTIRDVAYETSVQLAQEKGPFLKFDRKQYLQGEFIKTLPQLLQLSIQKSGIRNAVLLTQAPTGSVSLLAGVSSGIEPVYAFYIHRKDRLGEHTISHPLVEEWSREHPGAAPLPEYFVEATSLTPEEHVQVQARIQKYTDSSISKTVNAPNSHTVEDVKKLYTLAYELGCKGITYFRDGSREGVLSNAAPTQPSSPKTEVPEKQTKPLMKRRPTVVSGKTYRVDTPVGVAFINITQDLDGSPLEIFITVGKAGSDIAADAEAMGRLLSHSLRASTASWETFKELTDQLKGIGGASSHGFGKNKVRSLADAVARTMELHLQTTNSDASALALDAIPVTALADGGNTHGIVASDFCPECGQLTLAREEGCAKCQLCGFSLC